MVRPWAGPFAGAVLGLARSEGSQRLCAGQGGRLGKGLLPFSSKDAPAETSPHRCKRCSSFPELSPSSRAANTSHAFPAGQKGGCAAAFGCPSAVPAQCLKVLLWQRECEDSCAHPRGGLREIRAAGEPQSECRSGGTSRGCSEQIPLDQVAQGHIQSSREHLPGWTLHSLPGKHVPFLIMWNDHMNMLFLTLGTCCSVVLMDRAVQSVITTSRTFPPDERHTRTHTHRGSCTSV